MMLKFSLVVVSLLSVAGLAIASPIAQAELTPVDDVVSSVVGSVTSVVGTITSAIEGLLDGGLSLDDGGSTEGPGLVPSPPVGIAGDNAAPPTSPSDVAGTLSGVPSGL